MSKKKKSSETGRYVSRAGEKLEAALKAFSVDVTNLVCADFGCSTGGFTDCLLKAGAKRIYAVETGYGVLDWRLRNNPKIVVMERTNAMHVVLPEKCDLITIDVSWTKQEKILPNAFKNLMEGGMIISLIKPHYEAESSLLKGGVLSESDAESVVEGLVSNIQKDCPGYKIRIIKSPITGSKGGNVEFLMFIS